MAYNTYTTAKFISDVKLLCHMPTGNNTFTDSQILQIGNLELQTSVIKQILATRGGYYLTHFDQASNGTGIYDIPSDCVAGAIANIEIVEDSSILPVAIIQEAEQYSTQAPSSTSYGAFLRGNKVQVLPYPVTGQLRIWYFKRVSEMIPVSQAGQITAIAGDTLTVSSLPSTMLVGMTLDVLGDQPPFNLLAEGLEILSVNGTDVQLSAEVDGVSVGDWIALEGQTPVPQIPVEYRVVLAQRTVCKMYELQGYLDKLKAAQATLKVYEDDTRTLVSPRVQNNTKVLNAINGGMLMPVRTFPAGGSSH